MSADLRRRLAACETLATGGRIDYSGLSDAEVEEAAPLAERVLEADSWDALSGPEEARLREIMDRGVRIWP